ncbi:MAG: hypothetical protein ABI566_09475 [Pseudolysinimonas sp.]
MFGGMHWNYFELMGRLGSVLVGSILFLIWLAFIVLVVRFLLIGTRAAKLYLRNNGHPDGVLPMRAAAPAPPAAAAPTTKPASRTAKKP